MFIVNTCSVYMILFDFLYVGITFSPDMSSMGVRLLQNTEVVSGQDAVPEMNFNVSQHPTRKCFVEKPACNIVDCIDGYGSNCGGICVFCIKEVRGIWCAQFGCVCQDCKAVYICGHSVYRGLDSEIMEWSVPNEAHD